MGEGMESSTLLLSTIKDRDRIEPGTAAEVSATLLSPQLYEGQIVPGATFELYEGPRLVAEGRILTVAET
jgi:hypothetical protein